MARPKRIKAKAISQSTVELLARIQKRVFESGVLSNDGLPVKDFDPLEQLAVWAADSSIKQDDRIACTKELAKYLYPALKGVEIAGNQDKPLEIHITRDVDAPDGQFVISTNAGKKY